MGYISTAACSGLGEDTGTSLALVSSIVPLLFVIEMAAVMMRSVGTLRGSKSDAF